MLTCIDAAALLGCPTVGTFVGRNWTQSIREHSAESEEIFKPLVDRVSAKGVKIIIENCFMEG